MNIYSYLLIANMIFHILTTSYNIMIIPPKYYLNSKFKSPQLDYQGVTMIFFKLFSQQF